MKQENNDQNSPLLNFEEARAFLGNVPKGTLRDWTCKRRIPHVPIGKRVYYLRSDLQNIIKSNRVKAISELESEVDTNAALEKLNAISSQNLTKRGIHSKNSKH